MKGTVWRDVREVENRLKQSVLENYLNAWIYFLILKGHHHESSNNVLTTIKLKLSGWYHFVLQMRSP